MRIRPRLKNTGNSVRYMVFSPRLIIVFCYLYCSLCECKCVSLTVWAEVLGFTLGCYLMISVLFSYLIQSKFEWPYSVGSYTIYLLRSPTVLFEPSHRLDFF